jgi:hypothetical protein
MSAEERWQISDKDLHVLAGSIVTFGSTVFFLYASGDTMPKPLYVAAMGGISAACAGIGKEVVDLLGLGTADLRDALATAAGGLAAVSAVAFSFSAFFYNDLAAAPNFRYLFLTLSLPLSIPLLQYAFLRPQAKDSLR